MPGDADLEIGLRWDRRRRDLYVNLRFDLPGTSVDDWEQPEAPLRIDLDALNALRSDSAGYGAALAAMVLRDGDVGPFYRKAMDVSRSREMTLHLRLHIAAPTRFHALRWETLRDPQTGDRIAMQSRVLLSRYLSSPDWRPIPARVKHDLRALVVVAGPSDIDSYAPRQQRLAPVDVDGEVKRAREALGPLAEVNVLSHGRAGLVATLDAVERGIDVLYLVCHGALRDDVPVLYLEHPDATTHEVDGRKLVEMLSALEHRPTVVMLCSCQSATRGDEVYSEDDGDLSALGPRLAAAGVAAVVGMQGDVSMATAQTFAPRFFAALAEHGFVDRAMAEARRAIEDRRDWWVPVLYSRLRSGRTYYKPEFTSRPDVAWEGLRLGIQTRNLMPVLGPGLSDVILGSREDAARRWVERWQMPLATHGRRDLAQVAQFLRVRSAPGVVRAQLLEHLNLELTERCERAAPGDPFYGLTVDPERPEAAIVEVGRRLRADPNDPYRVVAALPTNVYVTTAWTDLLQDALRDADPPREPTTLTFRWNQPVDPDALLGFEAPTVRRPLVYHLFGRLEDRNSLVLTEDDYFAWFTAWLQRRKDVPTTVQTALISRSLVFLGFRLDDWDFRVIFHAIKSFGGSALLRENQHVGVQLDPGHQLIEPEAAQDYLESYFGEDKVSIFWGETASFLEELRAKTGLRT